MNRAYKVGVAAIAGFLITAGSIIGYWFAALGPDDCAGDCALMYAAGITWGLIIGALIGVACAFVAYVLTGSVRDRT